MDLTNKKITGDIDEGGKINSCTHQFCFSCIHDWSKITNQCPLCKGRFDIIEKFSSDGNLLDTIPVVFKQQVYEDENLLEGIFCLIIFEIKKNYRNG